MDKFFYTKDIGEAAALLSMEAVLKDIQWKDGVGYFFFQDSQFCGDLSQKYYFGQLNVPARIIIDNYKMLKRKLYNVSGKERTNVSR